MPRPLYKNNATSTLASGISDVATSLTFATGEGAKFASPSFGTWQTLTLESAGVIEIVKMTARSGDVATVVRAQESTTAVSWLTGATVEARLTAGMLDKTLVNMGTGGGAVAIGANWATGQFPVASAPGAVAIHESASATGDYATAVGFGAAAPGDNAAAVGYSAKASGDSSVAVGRGQADKESGVAIGLAFAAAESSSAIGARARTYARETWNIGGWPAMQRYEYGNSGASSAIPAMGVPFCAAMYWMDLGVVPAWQTSTGYTDGDVVRPTSPTGWQYYLVTYYYSTTPGSVLTTVPGETTEPTWPTTQGDSIGTNAGWDNGEWVAVNMAAADLMAVPDDVLLLIDEVVFVCYKYSGVTAAPFVSIGTAAAPTSLVNNQQMTGITGALQVHRFALSNAVVGANIRFKLETAATGGQFHGRFFVRGTAIQRQV